MGRHRQSGQPGSASSNSDAIANPHAIANPNPNATTYPATNPSAHPIAASNTITAPYPVTLGFTDPPADGHGPDDSPTGATSGSGRRWRWRAAFYRCGA